MDYKDTRAQRLRELIQAEGLPERGQMTRFAARIGRSISQVSQWLGGHRQIEEESARHIEQRCRKPLYWLDGALPSPPLVAMQEQAQYNANPWPFINISRADFQELTPEQRSELEGYARGLIALNRRAGQTVSTAQAGKADGN